MINWFRRPDWFKKGRKPKEVEPDLSGIDAPKKSAIVPTSPTSWWVYSIFKKDFDAYVKRRGKEPPFDDWYQHTRHYEKAYAEAWVAREIENDKKQIKHHHDMIAFRRDNPPIIFE